MKYFLILLSVISICNAGFIFGKNRSKSEITKIRFGCIKSSNYALEDALKLEKGTLSGSDSEMKYMYCYTTAMGFAHKDGHLIESEVLNRLTDDVSKAEIKQILQECHEVTADTPEEALYLRGVCLFEKGGEKLHAVNE